MLDYIMQKERADTSDQVRLFAGLDASIRNALFNAYGGECGGDIEAWAYKMTDAEMRRLPWIGDAKLAKIANWKRSHSPVTDIPEDSPQLQTAKDR
ncbi:MAG: hypothetical protein EOO12_00190 [Chitinophagaceae bacterium]|nr:MAG: hypothetical protein EOO12_00190 [Chitinophagaceae bacterium]